MPPHHPIHPALAVRVYAVLSRRDEELAARQWEVVLAEMEVGVG